MFKTVESSSIAPNPYILTWSESLDSFHVQQRYLDSYWRNIHPSFPIFLDRKAFDDSVSHITLKATVLALGAVCLRSRQDYLNGQTLHRQSANILPKVRAFAKCTYRPLTPIWQTIECEAQELRVEKIQAIFLCEVFSAFRAKRPVRCLSVPFLSALTNVSEVKSRHDNFD